MNTKGGSLSYQISNLPNNYIPKIQDCFTSLEGFTQLSHTILAFNKPSVVVKEPKLSQWDYLDQEKVDILLKLKTQEEINEFIGSTLKNIPKGKPKEFFIQLIADVTKFCQNHSYDLEKTATVLSQFYLTHLYFTSGNEVSAEKVYIYFKDLMMCHSLPFPPSSKKVFALKEARDILEFFCKIYLRNLPIILYMCLPNFALYLNYEIPPPAVIPQTTEKKPKKEKAKSGKKGKKK